jgi:hypothetical protein
MTYSGQVDAPFWRKFLQFSGCEINENASSQYPGWPTVAEGAVFRIPNTEYFVIKDASSIDLKGHTIDGARVQTKPVLTYLQELTDERRDAILQFHTEHLELIESSRGSNTKHQAWKGGYVDHLGEVFRIAEAHYGALSAIRPLSFTLDAAVIVLYFHDVEKIWKYTTGLDADFDKDRYYDQTLKDVYGIEFSAEERNGLRYIHGESDSEYDPNVRKAGPLAAFCHAADILSARMWFDEGKGLGV